jgi:CDP-6-deoxy-D-xylo-4-hexulose-3-dehydrase
VRVEEGLTNIDIVMNRMSWVDTYPGPTRPMLDPLADPIREHMPGAAR